MATFDTCIRGIRKDGHAPVYIRVTHKSKPAYIKTHLTVDGKGIKGKEIKDRYILNESAVIIKDYYDKLNRVDSRDWDVNRIVEYLNGDGEISFTNFFKKRKSEMVNDNRRSSAESYQLAYNSLAKVIGKENINFSDIKSKVLRLWIKSLSGTARAKNLYPVLMKSIWEAGLLEYNDYDEDIIRIKGNPFKAVEIPASDVAQKRAVGEDVLQRLFRADVSGCLKTTKTPLAKDVMELSFCLAAMNTADLYERKKSDYRNGKLCYERKKTRVSRKDKAYIEVKVPSQLLPLLKKYEGSGDYLFSFAELYYDAKTFNLAVNKGLKELSRIAGVEPVDTYTFRHSWATLAKNKCDASTEQVGFCLNHSSAHRTTAGYIEKDFSVIDKLNKKVIGLVFKNH